MAPWPLCCFCFCCRRSCSSADGPGCIMELDQMDCGVGWVGWVGRGGRGWVVGVTGEHGETSRPQGNQSSWFLQHITIFSGLQVTFFSAWLVMQLMLRCNRIY